MCPTRPAAARLDLLAGRVKVGTWTTAREHIFSRNLVPLAAPSARRLPALADLPTLKELGYAELVTATASMMGA